MRVGIYDLPDQNGNELVVNQVYAKILAHNGIPSVRLRVEQPDFWEQLRSLSLLIMRFQDYDSDLQLARDILPVIEEDYEIPCYPSLATGWHYDDKVRQYFRLKAHDFPMTESWVFYDRSAALEWADATPYPVVFKLRGGAGSANVILVKTPSQAKKLIRSMFGSGLYPKRLLTPGSVRIQHFDLYRELHRMAGNLYRRSKGVDTSPLWKLNKNYVLFQKFLPGNDWDTRVTVIGGRAFAFRRMVRDNDFRASGSGRINYEMDEIDMRCVEIALKISKKMHFQSMAYDFLINEAGEPEFCEISYTYLSSAVHACPGYWDEALNWHEGNFWPEHLHLIDALGLPDLEAPDLDY